MAFMEPSTWIFGHAGFLLDTCPLGVTLEVPKDALFLSMLCCCQRFDYGPVLFKAAMRSPGPRKEAGV